LFLKVVLTSFQLVHGVDKKDYVPITQT